MADLAWWCAVDEVQPDGSRTRLFGEARRGRSAAQVHDRFRVELAAALPDRHTRLAVTVMPYTVAMTDVGQVAA